MRRAIITAAAAAVIGALAAQSAEAGQLVWVRAASSAPSALWAANDDGTYPHQLLAANTPALAPLLASGTIDSPDVAQKSGTTVLFSGTLVAPADPLAPLGEAACAGPCAATFSLANGVLSVQSPPGAPAGTFERQPRLTAAGQLVEQYSSAPVAPSATAPGTPGLHQLDSRALGPPAPLTPGVAWSDTATETLPTLADPAPDPADPGVLAWVEQQDASCTRFALAGVPVCQYAVHVAGPSSTASAPPVAIFDDEKPFGRGPSSLAWSSDGSKLLLVDNQAPNDGIYTVPSSTAIPPAAKKVTEVIAEPPGWTFGQARFAGSKIVFDAHGGGRSLLGTSDIYAISAGCDSGTCSFPADATNLTRNAAADNVQPAWTSAAAPLVAAGKTPVQGAPAVIDAAALLSRTVTSKQGVRFEVTLSVAGSVVISLSRSGRTIGTTTLRLPAGATTFTITKSGGHPLSTGHDVAKLRVAGSTSVSYAASFNVH